MNQKTKSYYKRLQQGQLEQINQQSQILTLPISQLITNTQENQIHHSRYIQAIKFSEEQFPLKFQIYSDGACDSGSLQGGFSYFISMFGQKNIEKSLLCKGQGALFKTTSNQAELTAVFESLLVIAEIYGFSLPKDDKQSLCSEQKAQFQNQINDFKFELAHLSEIKVFTDSLYVIEGFSRDFSSVRAFRWRKGKQHQGIRYRNLWTRAYLVQQFFGEKLSIQKIKSKSTQGFHLNCDLSAKKMMRFYQEVDNIDNGFQKQSNDQKECEFEQIKKVSSFNF